MCAQKIDRRLPDSGHGCPFRRDLGCLDLSSAITVSAFRGWDNRVNDSISPGVRCRRGLRMARWAGSASRFQDRDHRVVRRGSPGRHCSVRHRERRWCALARSRSPRRSAPRSATTRRGRAAKVCRPWCGQGVAGWKSCCSIRNPVLATRGCLDGSGTCPRRDRRHHPRRSGHKRNARHVLCRPHSRPRRQHRLPIRAPC